MSAAELARKESTDIELAMKLESDTFVFFCKEDLRVAEDLSLNYQWNQKVTSNHFFVLSNSIFALPLVERVSVVGLVIGGKDEHQT